MSALREAATREDEQVARILAVLDQHPWPYGAPYQHPDYAAVLYAAGLRAMNGVELIAAERQRQIDAEGYDAAHDAGHDDELAAAGACYALAEYRNEQGIQATASPPHWPWDNEWWKPVPDDRIRELVKAGALIAAAIDSLHKEEHGG